MSWLRRYQLWHYFRNSTWLFPVAGIGIGLVLVRVFFWLDGRLGLEPGLEADAIRTLLGTLAGAMFTFLVFISSTLLLVVQVASAQLTPRIVGLMFRDGVTRFALSLFAFAFTFTLSAVMRSYVEVPVITTHIAAYLCLVCIGFFMVLVDHVGRFLRPSGALRVVARLGHDVIKAVYPRRLSEPGDATYGPWRPPAEEPVQTVPNPTDGVLLDFDFDGLVALACEAGCVVELVPQVGDFVAEDSPLFRIHGGTRPGSASVFCQMVALGQERTMEQDPAFAFRIMVDIASKALSAAINDPTTAVMAIDQLHYLLRSVGQRHLDEGVARDRGGAVRLVYRTPDWEDFVSLAVTEIRQFGCGSIQVVRRLRAMLQNLIEVLPPDRAALLRSELAVLQSSIERSFPEREDQELAEVNDLQGVGGKSPATDAMA